MPPETPTEPEPTQEPTDVATGDINPDDFDPADYPAGGEMDLPSVDPAEDGDAFCAAFESVWNQDGFYSLQESGDQLPPFTQDHIDAYAELQAVAPAAIKPVVDQLLAYGREMNRGVFDNGIEYEDLLDGPDGFLWWAVAYCDIDLGAGNA